MKFLTLTLITASLCFAQDRPTPKPFDHMHTKTEGGATVLTFHDKDHQPIAIVTSKGGELSITDKDGAHGWINMVREQRDGATIHTITSSSGKSLRFMVTAAANTEGPKRLTSIKLWRDPNWIELSPEEAKQLSAEEKKLFDTPVLQKLHALIAHSTDQTKPLIQPQSTTPGVATITPIQFACRATCFRVTVFAPIYLCTGNALPDACSCPQAVGFWDLECCCGFLDFTCLVQCSMFGGSIAKMEGGADYDLRPSRNPATRCADRTLRRRPLPFPA